MTSVLPLYNMNQVTESKGKEHSGIHKALHLISDRKFLSKSEHNYFSFKGT